MQKEEVQNVKLPDVKGRKDVFISYRSRNVEFATRLFHEFNQYSITAWFDKDVLHEYVGEEYTNIIHKGIENSHCFIKTDSPKLKKPRFRKKNRGFLYPVYSLKLAVFILFIALLSLYSAISRAR